MGKISSYERGKYPWGVALFCNTVFKCGSSLSELKPLIVFNVSPNTSFTVSRKHILTAAHCIEGKRESRLEAENCLAIIGISDLEKEFPESKIRKISEFHIHPDWNSKSRFWNGDIAVGVFKKLFEPTDFYKPICLNDKSIDNFYDQQGTVIGWGSTNIDGSGHSTIANEFSATIISNDRCRTESPGLINFSNRTSFCAGNLTTSAACKGEV